MDTGGTGSTASTNSEDERCFSYLTSAPPAQMVCDAAFRCDRDQQGALLGNVVVCGGGACLPGIGGANIMGAAVGAATAGSLGQLNEDAFPDRLREEIEAIVHQHTLGWRVKVTSPNVTERSICSWLGGSILGSLGTFQDMWVSKQDYEEYGSAIVNRKCP
jgi:actin-related protein